MPGDETLRALYDAASRRWWTYRDLTDAVGELARVLRGPSKALVFNFCRNDIRSIVTYLAALESGNAVALLDDGLAEESRKSLIDLYQPEFVSSDREPLWRRTDSARADLHPALALLLSTSGSTGSPRFVRLTRRNIEANAASIAEALNIGPSDCAIASLPIHYSYGLSVLNSHLSSGASFAITNRSLMESGFWETFRTAECTSFAGVPYLYQILNRLGPDRLNIPSLNTMTQAGGRMEPALIAKFSDWISRRGGRFFVMYGQTEATARISILPADKLAEKPDSVGLPIRGGRVSINGDGELCYSGPNVMMGYAACREDLALGDVTGGLLHTGDMARQDDEGFLYITGRSNRDAKLFGLRVNLDEVENMLRNHGAVAVISKGETLRIYCERGDEGIFAEYRRELSSRLRIHHSAFAFEHIQKIPLTSSGKIDYQTLAGLP